MLNLIGIVLALLGGILIGVSTTKEVDDFNRYSTTAKIQPRVVYVVADNRVDSLYVYDKQCKLLEE